MTSQLNSDKSRYFSRMLPGICMTLVMVLTTQSVARVIYVDAGAPSGGNGMNWTSAFAFLGDALNVSKLRDSVWVAKGTYYPTTNDNRDVSFELKKGVSVFGGFSGNESKLTERDWQHNRTILSGVFESNRCERKGGAIYNDFGCSPVIINCLFTKNHATSAAGVGNDGSSSPVLYFCTFTFNTAEDFGPTLYQGSGPSNNPVLLNSVIWANHCMWESVGIYNWHDCQPVVQDSIVEGGYPGKDNSSTDPALDDLGIAHEDKGYRGADERFTEKHLAALLRQLASYRTTRPGGRGVHSREILLVKTEGQFLSRKDRRSNPAGTISMTTRQKKKEMTCSKRFLKNSSFIAENSTFLKSDSGNFIYHRIYSYYNQTVSYLLCSGSDFMKKIIEEVLQTEKKVSLVLGQARNKASEIRQSVEKEISDKMSDAKQKAREIIQAAVEDAKKEAERIRKEKLKQADREKDTLLNNNTDTMDNLVDNICNIILTTEYEKDSK